MINDENTIEYKSLVKQSTVLLQNDTEIYFYQHTY